MSTFVKICGLRDAASIAAAVESGADALGFVFAASPRRITPALAAKLTRDVPTHIRRFAVTRHPQPEELTAIFGEFMPDYLQTDVGDLAGIELPKHVQAMPVYREGAQDKPASGTRLLFEGRNSGTGQTADWDEARAIARDCEVLLAGGLNIDNVAAAIDYVHPWGVDVSSGVERERGTKDPARIREFIALVRAQETFR